ncbi:zinc ribbon domain-containing protein [Lachnospiraceae bacterium 47-T17]
MALSMRTVIFSLVVLVALLTIPVMIGVYVCRDAKRRGMNAMAWTLIAVAAPALIGFIIYLLVRGNYPDLQCPQCAEPVTEQYVICPHCGAKLRPACPSCSFPVEADWKVCPKCAAPLEGVEMPPVLPQRQKDRTLGKILIAIIVVPVALIALAVFGLTAFQSVTGSSTMREVTFDEYNQEQESETVREAVHEWLDSLEVRSDRAYALRYDYSNELEGGQEHYYLFYVPAGGQSPSTSFGTDTGLFGTTLNLRLDRTGNSGSLYCVQTSVESTPKPRIILGGKHIRCETQVVDYNPTLFFIEPN